ncbi:MFS transporter, partial [Streptomyces virginiae]
ALFVMLLMLCRYAWSDNESDGLALLGIAVGATGAGFFAAAVVTPWLVGRLGPLGWITACSAGAAVLVPALGLFFAPGPMLAAAFVLGLATQGAKIATDTEVQSRVDDDYRGRVFSVYDVLFNVAFVGAAAVASLMLPTDGRSVALVLIVSALYAATAVFLARGERRFT